MDGFQCVTLRERPDLEQAATEWFHCKWGVPMEAYLASMVREEGEQERTRMYVHR